MNPSTRYSGLHVAARGAIAFAAVASFLAYQSTSSPARADSGCPAQSAPTLTAGVYSIDDSSHLQWVKVTTAAWDDSFIQTANIDMGGCVWDGGIAELNNPFAGTYDGGGYEIRNLDVRADSLNHVGLFDRLEGTGTIKDLGFTGNVNGVGTNTAESVGGLVGLAISGTILNSYTTGDVTTNYSGAKYVGGLVGWMEGGTVSGSYSTGDVTSQYSSTDTWGTGGLVGNAEKGTQPGRAVIEASHATGNVTATTQAGGLVGRTDDKYVDIAESYATGNVHASLTSGSAGGLVGFLQGNVVESYATGNVTGVANAQHLGGLYASGTGLVVDSFATGEVSGWTQSDTTYGQVGGLVGDVSASSFTPATFTRVYAATAGMTPSSGSAVAKVGGVAGTVSANLTWDSVAWNTETAAPLVVNPIGSAASVSGVSGFSTSQMQDITTFTDPSGLDWNAGGAQTIAAGYDPNYTWGICATVNNGYPFLTVMYSVSPCTPASPTPTFDTPVSTLDGFTVNVTNYDDSYTWTPSVTTGAVVAGTASGSTLPLIVTGLVAGADDTITVTTTRSGYTNGSATVMGSALEAALTPTFDTPVSTSTGYTVNVTNYDDSYAWTPSVSSGSVSAGTASGSTLPLTITSLSPGATATTTVATTRTGYAPGQAQVIGVALIPRASASPTSINFGVQTVGSPSAAQTITVTSTGTDNLTFGGSAVTITGTDSAMFSDDTDTCSGQTVTPSNTCTVEVTFTPTSTGAKSATLSIASNDPASPITIALSGGQNPTPPTPPTPTKPSAPTNVSGTAGDGQVSVTWQAPADSGTYAITDYQVTASPGGASCLATAPALTCAVTGLTNGTAYTFTVKALSGAGWGSDSAPSAAVTPEGPQRPGPVRDLRVIAVSPTGTISLAWRPPASDGGAPIRSYRVRYRQVGTDQYVRIRPNTTDTSIRITGLTPGQRYWVRVAARNKAGHGPGVRTNERILIPKAS